MKSFDQQVADWARTKPADRAYEYEDTGNCAVCQFLRETGMAKEPSVAPFDWQDRSIFPYEDRPTHRLSVELGRALIGDGSPESWTFGALADRLSA